MIYFQFFLRRGAPSGLSKALGLEPWPPKPPLGLRQGFEEEGRELRPLRPFKEGLGNVETAWVVFANVGVLDHRLNINNPVDRLLLKQRSTKIQGSSPQQPGDSLISIVHAKSAYTYILPTPIPYSAMHILPHPILYSARLILNIRYCALMLIGEVILFKLLTR